MMNAKPTMLRVAGDRFNAGIDFAIYLRNRLHLNWRPKFRAPSPFVHTYRGA